MSQDQCESCGMSMHEPKDHAAADPTSVFCRYCTTESGELQPFSERLQKFTQWSMRTDGLGAEEAENQAREYMRRMPAWKDHPALRQ